MGVAPLINGLLASSLADGSVCVLIQISDASAEAPPASVMIRGDACAANEDGSVSWSPDALSEAVPGSVDANCAFANDTSGDLPTLGFPVSLPDGGGLILPIRNIEVSGTLSGSGGITAGTLNGVIAAEDADAIMVEIGGGSTPLSMVLGEDNKDVDLDGDGEMDGWALASTYTAAAVEFN
jgi:hypothetical protein